MILESENTEFKTKLTGEIYEEMRSLEQKLTFSQAEQAFQSFLML